MHHSDEDDFDIPNQPLIERKKKQHNKKQKHQGDSAQRFNKVNRKRQMSSARIRELEEEIDEWY